MQAHIHIHHVNTENTSHITSQVYFMVTLYLALVLFWNACSRVTWILTILCTVAHWTHDVLTHETRKQNNLKGLWNDTARQPTLTSALHWQTDASRHADWPPVCRCLHFLIPHISQNISTLMLPSKLLPSWWQIWEELWDYRGPPTFELFHLDYHRSHKYHISMLCG